LLRPLATIFHAVDGVADPRADAAFQAIQGFLRARREDLVARR
jgi:hypothetical protein